MSENKAFEKLFHKEVTEKIAGTRIGNLNWGDMRFAFEAGQRQMNERKFKISVQKMVESHRETWWVCIDHPGRAEDAKPWDKGRTTPFMFEEKYKADQTADDFAEFFGDYAIRNHDKGRKTL